MIACLFAAAVLVATLLAPETENEPAGDEAEALDPLDVNTSLRLSDDHPSSGIPIERVDEGAFTRVDPDKVVRVRWERAQPLSEGVSEVTQPRARIFFEGGRALQVTAEEGRFVAPDRKPQSGVFRGNVVVTLVEAEPDEAIDFDDDAAVEMRVFIDGEARFDLVLNQIETADRVHLTGPRVEFFGTGLELSYNQRRNRLGRLDVAFGEVLRLKPASATRSTPSASQDETGSATNRASADAGDDRAEPGSASQQPVTPPGEHTFFRARFEDDVWIDAPEQDAELTGDAFELVFAMTGGELAGADRSAARTSATPLRAAPTPSGEAPRGDAEPVTLIAPPIPDASIGAPLTSAESRRWAFQAPPLASVARYERMRDPRDAERSMFVPEQDDLVVRWSGRMRVLPIASPGEDSDAGNATGSTQPRVVGGEPSPRDAEDLEDLAGPEDMLMRVTGDPAVIESSEGRRIAAEEIDYLGSTGRVRASGQVSQPVRVRSGALGVLRGTRLTWLPRQHRAEIAGPGELRRGASPVPAEGEDAERDGPLLVGEEELRAAWRDRLVLAFVPPGQQEPRPESTERIETSVGELRRTDMPESLESAALFGEVRVDHPRLRLDAGRVTLAFAEAKAGEDRDSTGREQETAPATSPRRIVAEQSADLRLFGDTPAEAARVRGAEIAIDLATDSGATDRPRPTRLVAKRSARVERDGSTLAADRIDARFAAASGEHRHAGDASLQSDTQSAVLSSGDLALSDLLAEGSVQLRDPEQDLVLTGHRLDVDPDTDTAELFGNDDAPAVARRDDGFITGPRIVLHQRTETVRVPGGGSFEALLDPEARDQTLNIDWARSMSFDRRSGLAEFHGEVHALAIGRREVTKLTSDSLAAQLDIGPASTSTKDQPSSNELGEPIDATASRRGDETDAKPVPDAPSITKVKRVTARGDALLKARVFATDPLGRPRTRLRMEGPVINFDNFPEQNREQVQVLGEGSMQIEDYRTAKDPPAEGQERESRLAGVTGRGATLLLWKDQLTLDAIANDLIAEGGITLLHRPASPAPGQADDEAMLQLDAQRLVADLAETGGLGVWLGDSPPAPELESLDAHRSVRVVRGDKTILADHMRFTRASDALRFTAEEGGFVRIRREGEATTPRARNVLYHLTEDRLQAFDVVGGAATGR